MPLWRSRKRKLARSSRLVVERGEQSILPSPRRLVSGVADGAALVVYNTATDKLEELGYSVEERAAELDIMLVEDESPYDPYGPDHWVEPASFLNRSAVRLNELLTEIVDVNPLRGMNVCCALVPHKTKEGPVNGGRFVGMCTAKFQFLELRHLSSSFWNLATQRLVECTGGIEGPGRYPSGPREQKKAERNSQWHHQTPLLTKK